mmetsp:Transcript_15785/g.37929  ORF Transcript_15785/g.37929 Transcript_15785/m.37929 type:complete len:214 (-) Transcript_15785:442-1083(-)
MHHHVNGERINLAIANGMIFLSGARRILARHIRLARAGPCKSFTLRPRARMQIRTDLIILPAFLTLRIPQTRQLGGITLLFCPSHLRKNILTLDTAHHTTESKLFQHSLPFLSHYTTTIKATTSLWHYILALNLMACLLDMQDAAVVSGSFHSGDLPRTMEQLNCAPNSVRLASTATMQDVEAGMMLDEARQKLAMEHFTSHHRMHLPQRNIQ